MTFSPSRTAVRIGEALEARRGDFVSGADLASGCGISRAAVWKHIQGLRAQGYQVEARRRVGYRLVRQPDRLTPAGILSGLHTNTFGHSLAVHLEVGSTMEEAARAASAEAPDGHLVIAERQSQGRGRLLRPYFCPEGGLWFSLVLRPRITPAAAAPISLTAAVAVAEAVHDLTGLRPELKWPNDLLLAGQKFCGILLQVTGEPDLVHTLIVGVGLNVNIAQDTFPADLRPSATSLAAVLGHELPRATLLQRVLQRLEQRYAEFLALGLSPSLEAWRHWPNLLGRRVRVESGGQGLAGLAVGLDDDGALLVEDDHGVRRRVVVGDVVLQADLPQARALVPAPN